MSQIQQVKDVSDIVTIVSSRVVLKRAGTYLKGLCPFHSEKTPSFTVNESLQRFRCFGCGASGDVLDFIQKYDGLTLYESLKYLADQAGITLSTVRRTPEDELKEQVVEVLSLSARYFNYLLTEHEIGEAARSYVKERQISQSSIKQFQLGYAPSAWDGLLTYLVQKKNYSKKVLQAAGLVVQTKSGRQYDRFRDRLIFPLKNAQGVVVGFSGRLLSKEAKEAKYINSPETVVYHKSKMLFGYHEAKQAIRQKGEVIVVEGEVDVITSMQAHVNNIVAIKGSALTQDHAKLIDRLAQRVLLALDTDNAGVEATKKALAILRNFELELRVIQLPGGKDPDELIRHDPRAWRQAVKSAVTGYDFLIETAVRVHQGSTASQKKQIIKELGPIFGFMSHGVELDYYQKKLAKLLQVSTDIIKEDLNREQQKTLLGVSSNDSRAENEAEVVHEMTAQKKMEHYLFFLLLREDLQKIKKSLSSLETYQFSNGKLQALFLLLQDNTQFSQLKDFARSLSDDDQALVSELYMSDMFSEPDQEQSGVALRGVIKKLKAYTLQKERQAITAQLEQLDLKDELSESDSQIQQKLLEQLVSLK